VFSDRKGTPPQPLSKRGSATRAWVGWYELFAKIGTFIAIVAAAVTIAPAVAYATADPASNGDGDCYRVGAAEYFDFRSVVRELELKGELSKQDADILDCDPRRAQERITVNVSREEPAASPLASGCRQSANWNITFSVWGAEAGRHTQSLSWCWNSTTRKVSDWGGLCSGSTTGWGYSNGWRWDGCTQNDFIPYTLGGSYPGGIHHSTQGKFDSVVPYVGAIYLRLSIWGHYDGTCDTKYNNTIRPYC
jgi:hypothetical protein